MFRKRQRLAEDAEADRQTRALQVLRDHRVPVTAFERKVAAIVRSRHVDPLKRLATAKALPRIVQLLDEAVANGVGTDAVARAGDVDDGRTVLLDTPPTTNGNSGECRATVPAATSPWADYDRALQDPSTIRRIADLVASVGAPTFGDVLLLPLRPPVFAVVPTPVPVRHRNLETVRCHGPHPNLYDFERLVFNNRTIHRYYSNTDFAAYLYQNLLFSLDARDVAELASDERWQAKLAVLLWRVKLNQICAFAAFYEDRVVCDGQEYDSSFVPFYDVRAIVPLSRDRGNDDPDQIKRSWNTAIGEITCTLDRGSTRQPSQLQTNDWSDEDGDDASDRDDRESVLYYYRDFDPATTARVPLRHMGLFMVFPFKAGYYVRPDGRPIFLNVKPYRRESVRLLMERVCGVDSLEAVVDSLSRQFDCEDAISYAVHSEDLVRLGVALLVLRRMVGDRVTIATFSVQLPTEMNVLEWTHTWCREATTVLPRGLTDDFCVERQLRLINEIANRAATELDVSMLCSPFRLIECQLEPVFRRLANDAERYVFYTLLMQDYPNAMYWRARKTLRPVFRVNSNQTHDTVADGTRFGAPLQTNLLTLSDRFPANCRPYNDSLVSDRVNAYAEPLVRPTDISRPIESHCQQLNSPERYEFTNQQLNDLVAYGNAVLTDDQYGAYVSMYL